MLGVDAPRMNQGCAVNEAAVHRNPVILVAEVRMWVVNETGLQEKKWSCVFRQSTAAMEYWLLSLP